MTNEQQPPPPQYAPMPGPPQYAPMPGPPQYAPMPGPAYAPGPPPPAGYPAAYPPGAYPPPPPPPQGQPVMMAPPGQPMPAPGQPMPAPGQPMPAPGQMMMVAMPGGQPQLPTFWPPHPIQVVCPGCNHQVNTAIAKEPGLGTWLIAGGICLVGCGFGCCLIPFCVDSCKDTMHSCPNCNRFLGQQKMM